jgi:hypothetical protein
VTLLVEFLEVSSALDGDVGGVSLGVRVSGEFEQETLVNDIAFVSGLLGIYVLVTMLVVRCGQRLYLNQESAIDYRPLFDFCGGFCFFWGVWGCVRCKVREERVWELLLGCVGIPGKLVVVHVHQPRSLEYRSRS